MLSNINDYKFANHTVYKCTYHIVFCPKYRRKILTNGIDARLKKLIYKFADNKKFNIVELEIMPDHVHMLADIFPDYAPLEMVRQLKYYTSKQLKLDFPEINKRLPNLWTRSCFISTTGGATLDVIKKYIENQKNK